jgi:hypothetical protein
MRMFSVRKEAVQGLEGANEVVRRYLSAIYTIKAAPQVAWRVWKKWAAPIGEAGALTQTIERH